MLKRPTANRSTMEAVEETITTSNLRLPVKGDANQVMNRLSRRHLHLRRIPPKRIHSEQVRWSNRQAKEMEALTLKPSVPEYCFYDSDPGTCRPEIFEPQWFYDRNDGVCKQFLYGGCGGNRNRFASREECEHHCGRAQGKISLKE